MKKYAEMTSEELKNELVSLEEEYKKYQAMGLKLNMTRGKPSPEQLDLSVGMMDVLHSGVDLRSEDGTDCRNYGVLEGIPEAKRLMADILEVDPSNIIIFGNSSLNIMFDFISRSFTHGVCGNTPFCRQDHLKWLCVVPGYDRHFKITEYFGFEMINIPMLSDGPDMDIVEEYVNNDPEVKGIWCVPKYSNPTGNSYSAKVVRRFAALKPAAPDFRIYWDNAYTLHHLYKDHLDHILEILSECEKAGNPDIVYKFASTSKVSFPGSGIAMCAASPANLKDIKRHMTFQTIGHDKVNQLRHVRFFKDMKGVTDHMLRVADILRPRFEAVEEILDRELSGLDIGTWTKPNGGYFISFDSMPGCASDIYALAKAAGVELTNVGATFPYGKDPRDSNIRIAPSFPSLEEVTLASEVFAVCVKLASARKLLAEEK